MNPPPDPLSPLRADIRQLERDIEMHVARQQRLADKANKSLTDYQELTGLPAKLELAKATLIRKQAELIELLKTQQQSLSF